MRVAAFVPEWLTDEVSEALAHIAGERRSGEQTVAKKEATVLRLAEALANGVSMNSVFERPDTCSKRVWYGYTAQNGHRKPGWRDEQAITTALAVATERARWWVRVKRGRAVESALEILVDGAEAAALQLVNLVRYGYVKFDFGVDGAELRNADVKEVLAASQALLDRVSALTAPKQTVAPAKLNADQFALLMKQGQAEAQQLEDEALLAWHPEESRDGAT